MNRNVNVSVSELIMKDKRGVVDTGLAPGNNYDHIYFIRMYSLNKSMCFCVSQNGIHIDEFCKKLPREVTQGSSLQ